MPAIRKVRIPAIRLDRSKPYSEVRGERLPNDPHYNVAYVQDGLPFDAAGLLVPDDGKTAPWEITVRDGAQLVTLVHCPLYSDEMRAKAKRKLDRIAKGLPATEEQEAEDKVEEDDVNLDMWVRGEVEYPPAQVFAAAHQRFSVRYTKIATLVEDMIFDHKVIAEAEVDPELRLLLPKVA